MFVRTQDLTKEQKHEVSRMCRKLVLWILEGRSTVYMADKLEMSAYQVDNNIDELLYVLKKYVGVRRFLRILFMK